MPIINRYFLQHTLKLVTDPSPNLPQMSLYDITTKKALYIMNRLYNTNELLNSIITRYIDITINLKQFLDGSYNNNYPNNMMSYQLAHFMFKSMEIGTFTKHGVSNHAKCLQEAIKLSIERSSNIDYAKDYPTNFKIPTETIEFVSKLSSSMDTIQSYFSASCYIYNYCLSDKFIHLDMEDFSRYEIMELIDTEKYFAEIEKVKRRYDTIPDDLVMYPMGFCTLMTYERTVYIITPDILNRSVQYLDGLNKLLIAAPSLGILSPISFITMLETKIMAIAKRDPEFVGEAFKAARNIMVAKLADDNLLDQPMVSLLMKEYQPYKVEIASEISSFIATYAPSIRSSLNLSMLYKLAIHPDVDMITAFEKLDGLYTPNSVDDDEYEYFEGVLRRAIYISMYKSGYSPRLIDGPLLTLQGGSENNFITLSNASPALWSECKFDICPILKRFDDMKVTISNKSSTVTTYPTISELETMKAMRNHDTTIMTNVNLVRKFMSVNDTETALRRKDNLDPMLSRNRIMNLARIHRAFNSNFNCEPELIPITEYRMLYTANPYAFHLVGTEPKLGEKHKKETRIFYMAQQEVKAYTQRVERLARQISKRQDGVSITKGMSARKRDMMSFIRVMTTDNESPTRPIFVSFDMSSFSMKFPMKLLRLYGKILVELTGDDIYDNLDIVFRSAVVFNSTREFFDYKIAPRGGFEGFFNFVWTSIHSAILETALIRTGLPGEIMTYSDDGLLKIIYRDIPGALTISRVIEKIQSTYLKLGLEFNLGKTIVSSEVWEYLGIVCYKAATFKTWIKELISIGDQDMSKSFCPFSTKINKISSQAGAAVHSGLNQHTAESIANYKAIVLLKRNNFDVPVSVLIKLLIIPNSCGGYRIPSGYEMAMSGGFGSFSEFLADLEILSSKDPSWSIITNYILVNMNKETDIVSLCLTNGWIRIKDMENNARSLLIDMLTYAESMGVIEHTSNPLDPSRRTLLNSCLSQVNKLHPDIMGEMILASPDIKEYEDKIKLMRSQAAFRILPQRFIKRIQARDSKANRNNVRKWHHILSGNSIFEINPWQLFQEINSAHNHILSHPRPSCRILYESAGQPIFYITTNYSQETISNYPSCIDSLYMEDLSLVTYRDIDLLWFAEAGGIDANYYARHFCNKALAVLSTDESLLPMLNDFISILGVNVPLTAAYGQLTRSVYRRRGKLFKEDILLYCPQGTYESTSVIIDPAIITPSEILVHKDLSSYPTMALNLHIGELLSHPVSVPNMIQSTYKIPANLGHWILTYDRMFCEEYKAIDIPYETKFDYSYLEGALQDAVEDIAAEETIASLLADIPVQDAEDFVCLTSYVNLFMIKQIKDYIKSSYLRSTYRPLLAIPTLPVNQAMRIDVAVIAVVESAIELYPVSQIESISELLDIMSDDSIDLVESKDKSGLIKNLSELIDQFINSLMADYAIVLPELISNIAKKQSTIKMIINDHVTTMDMFDTENVIVMILDDMPNARTSAVTISKIVRGLYRRQVDLMYKSLIKSNWSIRGIPTKIAKACNYDVDLVLDVMVVISSIQRLSDHRDVIHEPYNTTMAMILVVQIICISHFFLAHGYNLDSEILLDMWLDEVITQSPDMLSTIYEYSCPGLTNCIISLAGKDHYHRAFKTIDKHIIARIHQRVRSNIGLPSSYKNDKIGLHTFCYKLINKVSKVISKALSQKLCIRYSQRKITTILNEKFDKLSNSVYIIDKDIIPKEALGISISGRGKDPIKNSVIRQAFGYCYNEGIRQKLIPQLSCPTAPDYIKPGYLDNKSAKITAIYNKIEQSRFTIMISRHASFVDSLSIFPFCSDNVNGITRLYKTPIGYIHVTIGMSIKNYSSDFADIFDRETIIDNYDYVGKFTSIDENYKDALVKALPGEYSNDQEKLMYLEKLLVIDFETENVTNLSENDHIGFTSVKKKSFVDAFESRALKKVIVPTRIDEEPILSLATQFAMTDIMGGGLNRIVAYILLGIDLMTRDGLNGNIMDVDTFKELFDQAWMKILEIFVSKDNTKLNELKTDISLSISWLLSNPVDSLHPSCKKIRSYISRVKKPIMRSSFPSISINSDKLTLMDYRSKIGTYATITTIYTMLIKPLPEDDVDEIRLCLEAIKESNLLTYNSTTDESKNDIPENDEELLMALMEGTISHDTLTTQRINKLEDYLFDNDHPLSDQYLNLVESHYK